MPHNPFKNSTFMSRNKVKLPISEIEIEQFIFHVVHHGEDDPILMNNTPISGFETFFKQRIAEIVEGNQFLFRESSDFYGNINSIYNDEKLFLEVSQRLAKAFHKDDERIKAGVMILMKVIIQGKLAYLLLKYDHDNVVTYNTTSKGEAVLSEIKNSFSKNKDALQKSVIVYLDSGYAIVNDASNKSNITKFFKDFLGVHRKYEQKALTERLKKTFLNTVKHFKDELPHSYTSQASNLFYTIVQNNDVFDRDTFLDIAFGTHNLPKVEAIFDRELRKEDIYGEVFDFDKNIEPPKQKRYKTKEGVIINVPIDAEDSIKIADNDEHSIITITTKKLTVLQ